MSPAEISASADYPEHLRSFQRQRPSRQWGEIEPLKRKSSWCEIGSVAGFVIFLITVILVCG